MQDRRRGMSAREQVISARKLAAKDLPSHNLPNKTRKLKPESEILDLEPLSLSGDRFIASLECVMRTGKTLEELVTKAYNDGLIHPSAWKHIEVALENFHEAFHGH